VKVSVKSRLDYVDSSARKSATASATLPYFANGLEVGQAKREMERVKRISRPVWRACKIVAAQMLCNQPNARVALSKVQDWECG
jgi:hypothetical protein